MYDQTNEVLAIKKVVNDLFDALCWDEKTPPDWEKFRVQMMPETIFYPSARPVTPTTLQPFIAMMQSQRDDGALVTFDEGVVGHQILVFGNLAVSLSAYSQRANGGEAGYGVNGFLFLKEEDGWKIGAMCWDKASNANPLPRALGGK